MFASSAVKSDQVQTGRPSHRRSQRDMSITHFPWNSVSVESKPVLSLGYGTVAYFEFTEMLIVLFFVLSLLAIPLMHTFSSYDSGRPGALFSRFEIANMGFSSSTCRHSDLGVGKLYLTCSVGTVEGITGFGLIPKGATVSDPCLPNTETARCDSSLNRGTF